MKLRFEPKVNTFRKVLEHDMFRYLTGVSELLKRLTHKITICCLRPYKINLIAIHRTFQILIKDNHLELEVKK